MVLEHSNPESCLWLCIETSYMSDIIWQPSLLSVIHNSRWQPSLLSIISLKARLIAVVIYLVIHYLCLAAGMKHSVDTTTEMGEINPKFMECHPAGIGLPRIMTRNGKQKEPTKRKGAQAHIAETKEENRGQDKIEKMRFSSKFDKPKGTCFLAYSYSSTFGYFSFDVGLIVLYKIYNGYQIVDSDPYLKISPPTPLAIAIKKYLRQMALPSLQQDKSKWIHP